MPRANPTIVDVAARAGVSKGLVSLALNDRPGVADGTRRRILDVAGELGWQPSVRGRALSLGRAYAVALVLARDPAVIAADPFFPAFIAGAETALSRSGSALTLVMAPSAAPDDGREEAEYRRLARERRVDGVLLSDLRADDPRIALVEELGMPAVTLGRPDVRSAIPAVTVDDGPGIRAAVEHLVALGHRDIAHVAGPPRMLHGLRRRAEFEAAVRAAGLEPAGVVVTDFGAADGARATAELLDGRHPPTAIVYANDPMAIAGVGMAQSRGMRVPAELSVTGFDGSEIGAHLFPALTSVATEVAAWGEAAAAALLAVIDGRRPDDVDLPTAQLVVRDSTAPPPVTRPSTTSRQRRRHPRRTA